MSIDEALKVIVSEAVREALERELPKHLAAVTAAHEPARRLEDALGGAEDAELARIRRLHAREYLDVVEAAEVIGIDRNQVGRLVRGGHLPAKKIGNRYVLKRSDIDAFITAGGAVSPVVLSKGARVSLAARKVGGAGSSKPPKCPRD